MSRAEPPPGSFDSTTYGRSFADVYDSWYPSDGTTAETVSFVAALAGSAVDADPGDGGSDCPDALDRRPRVLELGVGTGRLALPLAAAGLDVVGIDSSPEMLDQLTAKDPEGTVRSVPGDVGEPDTWPEGPFDVVLAACNLICNLTDPSAQASCIAGSATRLSHGGHLVVEAFEPAPLEPGPRLTAGDVRGDVVVLIATDADPSSGVVLGHHVEMRDGGTVRLRPWRIRVTTTDELDGWAADAGLQLVERREGWGAEGGDTGLVSIYRRA